MTDSVHLHLHTLYSHVRGDEDASAPAPSSPSVPSSSHPPNISLDQTAKTSGRPRKLGPEGRARALRMLARNVPRAKVARALGVSLRTIDRLAAERAPAKPEVSEAEVARWYAEHGETYKRTADHFGWSVSRVARAVRKHARPSRKGRPGPTDPRQGKGKEPEWRGEDYWNDALGRRGRREWVEWEASSTAGEWAHVREVITARGGCCLLDTHEQEPQEVPVSDLPDGLRASVEALLYGEPMDDSVPFGIPTWWDGDEDEGREVILSPADVEALVNADEEARQRIRDAIRERMDTEESTRMRPTADAPWRMCG